jgi:DNA helicase-2/ATP-dependent DNA helicase PcrA
MFGFGRTVHTGVEKLHEMFPNSTPTSPAAAEVVENTFHLKHVAPSQDPANRPGPYERSKERAKSIAQDYVVKFGSDFAQGRVVEQTFEIPVKNAVIQGSIDLLLKVDDSKNIIEVTVVDFKTVEGGPDPAASQEIEWRDLAAASSALR